MTWLDIVSLAAIALLMTLAFKRGVVLELTDIICLTVGGFLGFRLYRPLGSALHNSMFGSFSIEFLEKASLFTIFIITCLVLFSFGLTFQRRAKEEKVLEKDVDAKLGLVVGFFKTIILVVGVIGLLFYNDAFPQREHYELKNGMVVGPLLGLSGIVAPIVYLMAPGDLAREFLSKGLGPAKSAQ